MPNCQFKLATEYEGCQSSYNLPRLTTGPYMTTQEVDIQVIPRLAPSQWITNDITRVRPWIPRYPIMTTPPAPIPLFVSYAINRQSVG